jgi:MFS family permease
MRSTSPGTLRNALGHRPFLLYFCANGLSEFSYQMAFVAVGWQVYALTNSAFALGMVGLAQFVPTALLTFVAGHAADRYDRRRVVQVCQLVEALTAGFLAWGTFEGWLNVAEIFAAVALLGAATAFESPAGAALLPAVVPEGMLQRCTALSTGLRQMATISGPALGGLAYAMTPVAPYAAMAVFWLLAVILTGAIKLDRSVTAGERPTTAALFAGVTFVRSNPAILGTISLDLFAVLLGGATALLPIYAHDILHTGPWGLGVLRAAPACGALMMTAVLAHYAINRRA